MLNNIVDKCEQCGQHKIVQSCFQVGVEQGFLQGEKTKMTINNLWSHGYLSSSQFFEEQICRNYIQLRIALA